MSESANKQRQADKAYTALDSIGKHRTCEVIVCTDCPLLPSKTIFEAKTEICGGAVDQHNLQNWLHVNGFPARRPLIHTVAGLAKQLIMGRSLPCLTQWIAQCVEAVTCPGCGKHTLFRERRMVCTGCDDIYPADKWAAGEPCDCGRMDARYFGIHSANRLGQLEFQQCQTPDCRWGGDYRRLTVQDMANAAQVLADEQWAAARTCPVCGEASGNDQRDGVYLLIEVCECGWQKFKEV